MPRNDLKAYTTVLARLPQDLADQVKQYASLHRGTVSELIRDGVEMRREAEVPGRPTGHPGEPGDEVFHEVFHGITEVLQAIKALSPMGTEAVRQTITEVFHEVFPHYLSRQPAIQEGMTGVLHTHVDFDPTRFVLGKLCKRGHEYQGPGQSLLTRSSRRCPQCDTAQARERRARRKTTRPAG